MCITAQYFASTPHDPGRVGRKPPYIPRKDSPYGTSRWCGSPTQQAYGDRSHLIYGIGPTRATELLEATGISPDLRTDALTDDQVSSLRDQIEAQYTVEGDLRREVQANIRRKIEIGSYQGLRHRRGLPVRGQRTKTNARTRKGPKKTIAGKKK